MGFLSASTSLTRYHAPAPAAFDRVVVAEKITRHAFHPFDGGDGVQRAGWVAIHDPLVTELSPADLFFQDYLVVGFRFDRRTVPAQLLRLERRRIEQERAREHGIPRLGAKERREIKIEVEARLGSQALPAPRIVDCVWNLGRGRLYLSGGNRLLREAFVEAVQRTFGVHPVPLVPYVAAEHVGLGSGTITAIRSVEPATLVPAIHAAPADVPQLPIDLEDRPQ